MDTKVSGMDPVYLLPIGCGVGKTSGIDPVYLLPVGCGISKPSGIDPVYLSPIGCGASAVVPTHIHLIRQYFV